MTDYERFEQSRGGVSRGSGQSPSPSTSSSPSSSSSSSFSSSSSTSTEYSSGASDSWSMQDEDYSWSSPTSSNSYPSSASVPSSSYSNSYVTLDRDATDPVEIAATDDSSSSTPSSSSSSPSGGGVGAESQGVNDGWAGSHLFESPTSDELYSFEPATPEEIAKESPQAPPPSSSSSSSAGVGDGGDVGRSLTSQSSLNSSFSSLSPQVLLSTHRLYCIPHLKP